MRIFPQPTGCGSIEADCGELARMLANTFPQPIGCGSIEAGDLMAQEVTHAERE